MLFRVFERLFVIALLLSSMGVVTGLTDPTHRDPNISGNLHVTSVAVEGFLNLCGALLVLTRWRRVLRAARAVWPLVALTALAPLSIAWSVDPVVTLRRSVLLLASTAVAVYLGERYSIEKLARLLAQAMCVMMIMVGVFYVLAPTYVIDQFGAWKGLSAYKNIFGGYMAVAVIVLLLVRFRQFRWLRYAFLVTAVVFLLLSRSATALAGCVLFIAAMPLWRSIRVTGKQRFLAYTVTGIALVTGIYLVRRDTGQLLQILGRDPTFTGRTHLWSQVLLAIAKHPVLGYGYGAFWTYLRRAALDVWIGAGWPAPLADNGYLDLCLSLGLVGVAAFVFLFVHSFRWAITYVRSEPGRIGLWPITYLCFFLLHDVNESTLLTSGDFSFLLFAIIATSLAVSQRRTVTGMRSPEAQPLMREWAPPALSGLTPGNTCSGKM